MSDHEHMVATVHAYVRGFLENDAQAICALFAEDATVEDPLGTPAHVGIEAVRRFYTRIMNDGGGRLELQGPVRTASGSAAFAFSSYLTRDGVDLRIDVIDVFQFDPAGKIRSMRAYWGPENKHTLT
jgi:steroid delta-isomerase